MWISSVVVVGSLIECSQSYVLLTTSQDVWVEVCDIKGLNVTIFPSLPMGYSLVGNAIVGNSSYSSPLTQYFVTAGSAQGSFWLSGLSICPLLMHSVVLPRKWKCRV